MNVTVFVEHSWRAEQMNLSNEKRRASRASKSKALGRKHVSLHAIQCMQSICWDLTVGAVGLYIMPEMDSQHRHASISNAQLAVT